MDIDASSPERMVELSRYPVQDPSSEGYHQVVAVGRAQIAALGAAELTGFVTPAGVSMLVDDAESLALRAHRSGGQGTAYLEIPDFSVPNGHPRLIWGDYAVGAVAYDVIPRSSPLRRLYEWAPMTTLIAAILDRGPLFPYADPFGALNLAVMGDGDQLQWHFDQTDFVVSLAIQTASVGGEFEVAPRIRRSDDERYDDVAAVLAGDFSSVKTLAMAPGTLLLFRGEIFPAPGIAHLGVDLAPRGSPRLRHPAGKVGSELLRQDRYGRTRAFAEPPDTWPPR